MHRGIPIILRFLRSVAYDVVRTRELLEEYVIWKSEKFPMRITDKLVENIVGFWLLSNNGIEHRLFTDTRKRQELPAYICNISKSGS